MLIYELNVSVYVSIIDVLVFGIHMKSESVSLLVLSYKDTEHADR